ncbi:GNAT family N-acetyltransferase [Nocardioides nanhaiensis]|uniref:GNAT family N-acetyltransferase n=1 Tax=Nocardioides nanhaiensis TaxID=1476871 RepID=A0ABP8W449_9ACTN
MAAYDPFLLGRADPYRERLADVATRDREAEVWVAVQGDGDRVLGAVTVCPPGGGMREVARPEEGEFRMLAVHPAAQGRGVGEALATLVVERFRRDGAPGIALSSLTEMHGAHRLYERLGFVRDTARDWSPVPGVQLIAYHRELP